MFKWLFIALFSVETSCYLSVVIQYDHKNFFVRNGVQFILWVLQQNSTILVCDEANKKGIAK